MLDSLDYSHGVLYSAEPQAGLQFRLQFTVSHRQPGRHSAATGTAVGALHLTAGAGSAGPGSIAALVLRAAELELLQWIG